MSSYDRDLDIQMEAHFFGDVPKEEEEEILDQMREELLSAVCSACGYSFRECVCPVKDPFEEPA